LLINILSIEQTLQKEIQESKIWVDTAEGVYKRDLICGIIESKMNEMIDEINKKHSIIESDPLDSELRILDWIFYQVCSNEIKKF
jgi:hypothetical protein